MRLTPTQLDQLHARRDALTGLDIWADGDECGDQIRADLDVLLAEVERLHRFVYGARAGTHAKGEGRP